ncbi:MAG: helix-turn-helix domain-containing protein, partial [Pseudomonadota bacterium]
MKLILILSFPFVATFFKLLTPGGVKSVMAENLLVKHQLIIMSRTRKKSPNLKTMDRFILGILTLVIHPGRLRKNSVILKVSTILNIHQALVKRKYRPLFSSDKMKKIPGPKGPRKEIIEAVIEMKNRNPRMGC